MNIDKAPSTAPSPTAAPVRNQSIEPAATYPHFRENVMACTSNAALDQYLQAVRVNDQRGVDSLVRERRCIIPKSDIQISVLDRPSLGKAHVRAYTDSGAIELWTTIEALSGI
jgi:hypothetical protein